MANVINKTYFESKNDFEAFENKLNSSAEAILWQVKYDPIDSVNSELELKKELEESKIIPERLKEENEFGYTFKEDYIEWYKIDFNDKIVLTDFPGRFLGRMFLHFELDGYDIETLIERIKYYTIFLKTPNSTIYESFILSLLLLSEIRGHLDLEEIDGYLRVPLDIFNDCYKGFFPIYLSKHNISLGVNYYCNIGLNIKDKIKLKLEFSVCNPLNFRCPTYERNRYINLNIICGKYYLYHYSQLNKIKSLGLNKFLLFSFFTKTMGKFMYQSNIQIVGCTIYNRNIKNTKNISLNQISYIGKDDIKSFHIFEHHFFYVPLTPDMKTEEGIEKFFINNTPNSSAINLSASDLYIEFDIENSQNTEELKVLEISFELNRIMVGDGIISLLFGR